MRFMIHKYIILTLCTRNNLNPVYQPTRNKLFDLFFAECKKEMDIIFRFYKIFNDFLIS